MPVADAELWTRIDVAADREQDNANAGLPAADPPGSEASGVHVSAVDALGVVLALGAGLAAAETAG